MGCKLTFAGKRFENAEELELYMKEFINTTLGAFDLETGELLYYTTDDLESYLRSDEYIKSVQNETVLSEVFTESVNAINELQESLTPTVDPRIAVNKRKTETTSADEAKVNALVSRILANYNYKVGDDTGLMHTEKMSFINVAQTMATQVFTNFNQDELSADIVMRVANSVKDFMNNQFAQTVINIKAYIAQSDENTDATQLKSAKQLLENMEDLISDDQAVKEMVSKGIDLSVVKLGFKKNTVMAESKSENDQEQDSQDSWQEMNFSILKNVNDGITARLKAKFLIMRKYTVRNDEVVPDLSLLGTPVVRDDALISVIDMLADKTFTSLDDKIAHLRGIVSEISMNPKANVDRMFLRDLVEMLDQKSKLGKFTDRDLMQFNTVTNKSRNDMKGIGLNPKSKRLQITDFVYNTIFKRTLVKLNALIDNLRSDELGKSFMEGTERTGINLPSVKIAGKPAKTLKNFSEMISDLRKLELQDFKDATLPELLSTQSSVIGVYNTIETALSRNKTKITESEYAKALAKEMKIPLKTMHDFFQEQDGVRNGESYKAYQNFRARSEKSEDMISEAMVGKLEATLTSLELPITPSMRRNLLLQLTAGTKVPTVDFYGNDMNSEILLSTALNNFIKDVVASFNNSTPISPKGRPFLKWLSSSGASKSVSSTQQVGSKSVSTLVDPIYLETQFKKILNDAELQKEINEDIFSAGNSTLSLLNSGAEQELDWLGLLYRDFHRSGLKATWLSDTDDIDTADLYSLWEFGSYLTSTEEVYEGGKSYDQITVQSGDSESTLEVRPALLDMPTHSDKDATFSTTALDFNSVDDKGDIKREYIKFFIDSNITPEIRRLVHSSKANNINGYYGKLIYQMPSLNMPDSNGVVFTSVLGTMKFPPNFTSVYSKEFMDMNKWTDVKYIINSLEAATHEMLDNQKDSDLQKLVDTGILTKAGDFFLLGRDVSDVEDFKNLLIDKKTLLATNEKFQKEEAHREKVVENIDTYLNDLADIINKSGLLQNGEINIQALSNLTNKSEDFVADYLDNIGRKTSVGQVKLAFELMGWSLGSKDISNIINASANLEATVLSKELLSGEQGADIFALLMDDIDDALAESLGLDLESLDISTVDDLIAKWDALVQGGLDIDGLVIKPDVKDKKEWKAFDKSLKNEAGAANYSMGNKNEYTKKEYELGLSLKDLSVFSRVGGSGKVIDTKKLNRILSNKGFSYAHHVSQVTQLLYGDPAAYHKGSFENKNKLPQDSDYNPLADLKSTYGNMGKRYGMFVSPAVMSSGRKNLNIKYIAVQEFLRDSHVYTEGNQYGVDAHTGIEVGDAMTYVTKKSYAQFLLLEGVIEESEVADILNYWEGKMSAKSLDDKYVNRKLSEKASIISTKPRVVGTRREKIEGTQHYVTTPVYIKMSEMVLTEQFTGTNTDNGLVKMRMMMEQLESDSNPDGTSYMNWTSVRIAPPTAIKVGNVKNKVDVENATMDSEGRFMIDESNVLDLKMSMYGRQNRTDAHTGDKLKSSGQQADIFTTELEYSDKPVKILGSGGSMNLLKAMDEVTKAKRELALREVYALFSDKTNPTVIRNLIAKETGTIKESVENLTSSVSDEKLSAIIKSAIIAQNKTDITISNPLILKGLDISDNGEFEYDLAGSEYLQFYLDVLRSAMEKKTIKRKRSGFKIPLISDVYFNTQEAMDGENGVVMMSDYVPNETGTLRPQTPTTNAENNFAEIILPWDFQAYNEKGKLVDLNMDDYMVDGKVDIKLLPQEVLRSLVYRTPNQDYSMSSAVKIVGFLPKSMKNSVMAPAEFVALMGSDFDIDKLFGYKQNWTVDKKGRIRAIDKSYIGTELESEYWDNRENDVLMTIANQQSILKNDTIKELIGEQTYTKGIVTESTTPLSDNASVPFIDRVDAILNFGKINYENQSMLSHSFQQTKRDNAIAAGTGTGVFAKFARVYAQVKTVKPNTFTSKSANAVQKSSIPFGPMNFKKFGDDRPSIFEVTDENGDKVTTTTDPNELDFDKTKTNTSALISVNVDNEAFQMIHRLNINNDTYDTITSLMTLGFRSKVAIAMTTLSATFDEEAKLRKIFNVGKTGDAKMTKDTNKFTGADISFVHEAMDEMVLVDNILELSETMARVRSDGFEGMNDVEIQDYFAIKAFVSKVNSAYKTTIQPFSWAVNSDSKGIQRNLAKLSKQITSTLPGGKFSRVWEQMGTNPTQATNAQFTEIYNGMLNRLFKNDSETTQIMDLLAESNIALPGLFDASNIVRATKLAKLRPNFAALRDRLNILKTSEVASELMQNNQFLSRLIVKGKSISFRRDNMALPVDIQSDLEGLIDMGEVAGVDMELLYYDLVYYGATTTNLTYGNTYTQHIDPLFLTTSDIDASLSDNDIAEMTAFVAFKNLDLVPIDNSENPATKFSKTFNKKTNKSVLRVTQVSGNPKVYSEKDFKGFNKLSAEEQLWKLYSPEDTDDTQVLPSDSDVEINYEETLERVFSSKADLPFKKFMKIINPGITAFASKGNGGEYNWGTASLDLGARQVSKAKLKATLRHEAVHVALAKVVDHWNQSALNQLFVGDNVDNDPIFDEINDTLTQIDEYRGTVIDGFINKMGKPGSEINDIYKLEVSHSLNALAFNLLSGDFYKLVHKLTESEIKRALPNYNKEAIEDVMKAINDGNLPNSEKDILQIALLQKGFKNNWLTSNANNSAVFDGVNLGFGIDSNTIAKYNELFDKGMKAIQGNYARLLNEFDTHGGNAEYKAEFFSVQQALYGTINTNEFTAQAFAYGTGASSANYRELADMQGVRYNPISEREYQGIMSKVFNALKRILTAILGKSNGNKLWKDVNYLMLLNNSKMFVSYEANQSEIVGEIDISDTGLDLMDKCK